MAGEQGLDQFYQDLSTSDTKKKISQGQAIINYLGDAANSIDCEDTGGFVDALVPWMQSSNFKVSQNGLDIIGQLVDRLASDFKPYLNTVLSSVVDRLGDTREVVREKANIVLCKLMDATVVPQQLFEKILPAFTHKNGKVREEVMLLLQNTLNAHGAQSLTISKLIPAIVTATSDPQAAVRDAAIQTLVEIYRHVGERVRQDLQKKQNLPSNKLASLMVKFDEVRTSGNMMPTATLAIGTTEGRGDDETDGRLSAKSAKSRSSSVPANRERKTFATPKPPTADGRGLVSSSSGVRRQTSVRYGASGGGQAGAVDEDSFIAAFEDVKKVTIFSGRALEEELSKVHTVLSNDKADWKQRIEALSMVRALMVAGAAQFEELTGQIKALEYPFESCVKDLRSQVVRECCITVAYMSQQLHHKVDRFLEFLLPPLINLIQNSAKVMATSGLVCLRFIIQNTYSPRFLPIICQHVSSKSKEIRRHVCEFLDQLLHSWPPHALEKHVSLLQEAIKKGVSDADPDARTFARKAYWGFADHFKEQADSLLSSLEPSYKKLLQGEMSNSSSSNSLNTVQQSRVNTVRSRQSSVTGSQENLIEDTRDGAGPGRSAPYRGLLSGSATLGRKTSSGIPKWSAGPSPVKGEAGRGPPDASLTGSPRHTPPGRSNSAIDATAARRASVRQQYSQRGRLGLSARPRKSSEAGPGLPLGAGSTPDRNGRPRSRAGGVSQSQPGSRSASPSSIKSYHTYLGESQGTPTYSSATKSPMRKRSTGGVGGGPFDGLDNSDESETSSLCSEKSFDYGRGRPSDDITDIIANCASTHWADRKDGLIGLQSFFREGRMLTATELRRITDIFTKMFMDAHTKVFALFLETLCELVASHKADLHDWLYILLTRLLNKLGADLLGSVIHKINRTLDVVRESFGYEDQLAVVFKFLVDQTQTPNSKVKLATLQYLRSLVTLVETADVPTNKDSEMALAKIITWTSEPKSGEIRRAAHQALVSMFHTHNPQMSLVLARLPQVYQDNAAELLDKHLPLGEKIAGSSPSPNKQAGSSGLSPMQTRVLQPTPNLNRPRQSPHKALDPDDSENMNPDEVNKSLRLTANAIQNYSFDKVDKMSDLLPDEKDSGISQVSLEPLGLEEKLAGLELGEERGRGRGGVRPAMEDMLYGGSGDIGNGNNGTTEVGAREDKTIVQDMITTLQAVKMGEQGLERRQCMTQLIRMARSGNTDGLTEHFRTVLRVLLENLEDQEGSTRALVFGVLTEMMKQESLQPGFHGFTELVILKVLQAHKDQEKDVVRAAESCAATMAGVLPAEMVVRVLNPIVKTGDFPVNQAAIKMLTKLVEKQTPESVEVHLAEIMPGLLKAYDNVESSVRKAAVFCIVSLHQLVGEDTLQPHLDCLNGSKMKLLSLYIKRAQVAPPQSHPGLLTSSSQAQSTTGSPRMTPS